eukprot:54935-Pyramimonas_sp.AAC.1
MLACWGPLGGPLGALLGRFGGLGQRSVAAPLAGPPPSPNWPDLAPGGRAWGGATISRADEP